jgi:hypothetical protein
MFFYPFFKFSLSILITCFSHLSPLSISTLNHFSPLSLILPYLVIFQWFVGWRVGGPSSPPTCSCHKYVTTLIYFLVLSVHGFELSSSIFHEIHFAPQVMWSTFRPSSCRAPKYFIPLTCKSNWPFLNTYTVAEGKEMYFAQIKIVFKIRNTYKFGHKHIVINSIFTR